MSAGSCSAHGHVWHDPLPLPPTQGTVHQKHMQDTHFSLQMPQPLEWKDRKWEIRVWSDTTNTGTIPRAPREGMRSCGRVPWVPLPLACPPAQGDSAALQLQAVSLPPMGLGCRHYRGTVTLCFLLATYTRYRSLIPVGVGETLHALYDSGSFLHTVPR